MSDIARLIAEAEVLAGGQHQCAVLGHRWKSIGGRPCPFREDGDDDSGCGHSQAVHECESCGDIDYGENPGEPGYDWCAKENFNCGERA
jgi:hypothetical protein